MQVAEAVLGASALFGCVSGAASGARESIALGVVGAGVGFVLGALCFFALEFPYLWCFTRVEMPGPCYSMTGLGKWLFFPLMAVILLAAAVLPWLAVGLFV
jgi:hypothetical protein